MADEKDTQETTPDAHTQADDTTSGADTPTSQPTPVVAGTILDEVVSSDKQTRTVNSTATGQDYEEPKFRAVIDHTSGAVGISLFNWVGPEALTIPADDVKDFKAFVRSL